jgi:hypothetical protein
MESWCMWLRISVESIKVISIFEKVVWSPQIFCRFLSFVACSLSRLVPENIRDSIICCRSCSLRWKRSSTISFISAFVCRRRVEHSRIDVGRDLPFDIVDHSLSTVSWFASPVLIIEICFWSTWTFFLAAANANDHCGLPNHVIFVLLPNLLPIHLCQVAPHIDVNY